MVRVRRHGGNIFLYVKFAFYRHAGFGHVRACAVEGGDDLTYVCDGEGFDCFYGRPDCSYLRNLKSSCYNLTTVFDCVNAFASDGDGTQNINSLDFAFDDYGNEL